MHSSITSSRRYGRNARSVKASAEASAPALAAGSEGLEFIDRPEIQIARDQHLYAIALMLHDRRRDVDRALQDLGHDILRRGGVDDDRAAVAAPGLNGCLNGSVDHRDQHGGAKTLPEMTIDVSGKTRATQFVRPRRCQRHNDARWRACLVPQDEDPRRALLYLAASLADELGAALQQDNLTVNTESVGCHDASGHAGQGRVDGRFQGAIEERALGQQ